MWYWIVLAFVGGIGAIAFGFLESWLEDSVGSPPMCGTSDGIEACPRCNSSGRHRGYYRDDNGSHYYIDGEWKWCNHANYGDANYVPWTHERTSYYRKYGYKDF